jgi:hypothetical protein
MYRAALGFAEDNMLLAKYICVRHSIVKAYSNI